MTVRRPSLHEVDWARHEVEPRWLGYETAHCVAALEPNLYNGTNELRRFLAGAARRDETALIIAVMGTVKGRPSRPPGDYDDSIALLDHDTTIYGCLCPQGTRPVLADALDPADRDLGLRLLNRPPDASWWEMQSDREGGDPAGAQWGTTRPAGQLRPILLDPLGTPVVAVWVSPDERERWYIVPDGVDWDTMIDWLVQRAVPAYAPDAPRRHRLTFAVDADLETPAETEARAALADLEVRYARDRARLQQDLADATAVADPIRNGLMFGTGSVLVDAVTQALSAAGFTVDDVDARLGATVSADLLVTFGPHHRLVEVKSEGGRAKEALVGDLLRHLSTWGGLQPDSPVDGGTLIVNHQRKQPPGERFRQIYGRPEFVKTLTVPVVGTLDLFDWWKTENWEAIRTAVLGTSPTADGQPSTGLVEGTASAPPHAAVPSHLHRPPTRDPAPG
ncbi:hypothetical protein ACQPZF_27175 [Actinosynnema sp. CS-041913]|uniref:hypothetical protein n=1 Tax=Actinosynnema sp. CS-041913 TaxID=3239917 RepID=UPI003D8E6598